MSYINPDIVLFANPVGIDAVIQSIQQDLYAGLPWLTKSFGRAYEFKEAYQDESSVKSQRIPKVFVGVTDTGQGEYYNVLPNDNITAQSFIAVKGFENWPLSDQFAKYNQNGLNRQLSVIFWVNLEQIDPSKKYIFTEELKIDVEKILKANPFVSSLLRYVDERAEDVFDTYDLRTVNYTVDDDATQYLMYPYAGFRFDVQVDYAEFATCNPFAFRFAPAGSLLDIERVSTGGETEYQNSILVGKKIRLIRGGILQTTAAPGAYYSFDSSTGTISFFPSADPGEVFSIQIYSYASDDIEITAVGGEVDYQNDVLIGKRVRFFRGGVQQNEGGYGFDSGTGELTFSAADPGEILSIQIYAYE
jgi:hypothetical protein